MARYHYYRFPENVDAKTRFLEGADYPDGSIDCTLHPETSSCRGCEVFEEIEKTECFNIRMCPHVTCSDADDTIPVGKVSYAKELLKKYGGTAWTNHCERDGGCFEVTEIKLKGNNSKFKYNHHL